jgi:hypothetical protein
MKPYILISCVILLLSFFNIANAGSSTRYALVIGNNYGNNNVLDLDNLKHAEREAAALKETLIRYGNFDHQRVILVAGQGREQILQAAEQLAKIHQADEKEIGKVPTLFALFYTGHGLTGKLLTADQPITGTDLAQIFKQMSATLNLGFFDACFAGSIDLVTLKSKGVISTPGFNPLTELPEELLNSEGTLWFVSSRPNELSYEDEELGGLLTHFFVKSFTNAPQDGVGITLDSMWEYARRKTLAHVGQFGRSQTPEKIIRHLKARGPLYFSFPTKRSASLVFEESVSGTFLLHYQHGALVEKVKKRTGRQKEVAVYQGRIALAKLDSDRSQEAYTRYLDVAPGSKIHIHASDSKPLVSSLGYGQIPIQSKGEIPGLDMSLKTAQTKFALGTGYRFNLVNSRILGTAHQAQVNSWFVYGPWSLELGFAYGRARKDFDSWGVKIDEYDVNLSLGWGIDLDFMHLNFEAIGQLTFFDVVYHSNNQRNPIGGFVGAAIRASWPIPIANPWVILQTRLGLGGHIAQGMAYLDQKTYFLFHPILEAGIYMPF